MKIKREIENKKEFNLKIKTNQLINLKKILLIIVPMFIMAFVFLIIFLPTIYAETITGYIVVDESQNLSSSKEQAQICLNYSEDILLELENASFSIERVNDTLTQAKALYADTLTKRKDDYTLTINLCNDIKRIKDLAYSSQDQFDALKKFYVGSLTPEMNTTEIDSLMENIKTEIQSERYEKVEPLINDGYEKIINLKSSYTTLNIFNRNLRNFFVRNWQSILITILVIAIPLFLFRKKISRSIIKSHLDSLIVRKKTLKGLIRQTQKDYFESGKISEGMYNIKTKKFAELIRDIDRQTPLLEEELIKLERSNAFSTIEHLYHQNENKRKRKDK